MTLVNILNSSDPNKEELKFYLDHLVSGDAPEEEIVDALATINKHGISFDLLSCLVSVLEKRVQPIDLNHTDFIDTCGTGGSGLNIFNCSTLSAFVVCAAGGRVVKHGNKSVTSQSGSADFLERAGVNLTNSTDSAEHCLSKLGITFLFAPKYHQDLKNVASARKKIGVRTIFNVVGPLANPAKPDYQIIGTSNKDLNEAMIQVLQNKGLKQAMVVTSKDGIDELSITDVTHVHELRNNQITTYDIDPTEFGLSMYPLKDIQVNTSEEAYLYGVEVLNGKRGAGFDMVALNAGAALYISNITSTMAEGIELAIKTIHSGKALLLLNKFAKFTQHN